MTHHDLSNGGNALDFPTLTLPQVEQQLRLLYERVARHRIRIHITDDQGRCDCVLVSKEELESLEQALALLGDSDHVQAMHASLQQLISAGGTA